MKKILNILILVFVATSLSSCLKDKSLILTDADGAIKNVIEFQSPSAIVSSTSSPYPVYSSVFNNVPEVKKTLTVHYAGVDNAPEDITVKVALFPAGVTGYNAKIIADVRAAAIAAGNDPNVAEANAASQLYTVMPSAWYTLGNLTLTIPKGQRSASLDIMFKASLIDFNARYVLPLTIESVSSGVLSGNFKTILINASAKNPYDGVYRYQSTNTLRGTVDEQGAELVTKGADAVTTPLVNYYTAASNLLTYRINPTTNAVTVEGGGIGAITVDPTSNWNPVTKTLYVKWNTSNRSFVETWTWTGDRD